MDKFPFQEKSVEELVKEMDEAIKNAKELTEEEERMYDVEMYSNEALELFDNLPYKNYFLRELIESLISREK